MNQSNKPFQGYLKCNYYVANFDLVNCTIAAIIIIAIVLIAILRIYQRIKKMKKITNSDSKTINTILIVFLSLFVYFIFVGLETTERNKIILFWKINTNNPKTIYIQKQNEELKKEYSLKNKFPIEMQQLTIYEQEYSDFLKEYKK